MIAIAALSPEQVQSDKVIAFFGMQYTVPWSKTCPARLSPLMSAGR
jgi:hypothetical protein